MLLSLNPNKINLSLTKLRPKTIILIFFKDRVANYKEILHCYNFPPINHITR